MTMTGSKPDYETVGFMIIDYQNNIYYHNNIYYKYIFSIFKDFVETKNVLNKLIIVYLLANDLNL